MVGLKVYNINIIKNGEKIIEDNERQRIFY